MRRVARVLAALVLAAGALGAPMPPTLHSSSLAPAEAAPSKLLERSLFAARRPPGAAGESGLPVLLPRIRTAFEETGLTVPRLAHSMRVAIKHHQAAVRNTVPLEASRSGVSLREDLKSSLSESGQGPFPLHTRKMAEYISQSLQGSEKRDAAVIKRAQDEKDSRNPSEPMKSDSASGSEVGSVAGGSADAAAQADSPPTIGNGPVSTGPEGQPKGSAVESEETKPTSSVARSFWEGMKSAISKIMNRENASEAEGAKRSKGIPLSERDVDALVKEIIKQVQLRTKQEFNEHREFLQREQNFAVRAAFPHLGPAPTAFAAAPKKVLASSGLSSHDEKAVRFQSRKRLSELAVSSKR